MKITNQKGFAIVGVIALIVVVVIAGLAVWQISDSDQQTQESASHEGRGIDEAENQDQATTDKAEDMIYTIHELGIAIDLTDDTKDLIHVTDGNFTFFSLQGFLNDANKLNYSRIDSKGDNTCERLGSIRLFDEDPNETGMNPLGVTVYDLDDGRFYIVSASQAPCAADSFFDPEDEIVMKNTEARSLVLDLLQSNVRSLN